MKPPRNVKQRAAAFLPASVVADLDRFVFAARRLRIRAVHRVFGALGYNVVKKADHYSTLPVLGEIEQTRERWDRPSPLTGLDIDVFGMRKLLEELTDRWEAEFSEGTARLPGVSASEARGTMPAVVTATNGRLR